VLKVDVNCFIYSMFQKKSYIEVAEKQSSHTPTWAVQNLNVSCLQNYLPSLICLCVSDGQLSLVLWLDHLKRPLWWAIKTSGQAWITITWMASVAGKAMSCNPFSKTPVKTVIQKNHYTLKMARKMRPVKMACKDKWSKLSLTTN